MKTRILFLAIAFAVVGNVAGQKRPTPTPTWVPGAQIEAVAARYPYALNDLLILMNRPSVPGVLMTPPPPMTFTVTNTTTTGPGSFRQAILDANANPGADNIVFNIPGAGVHTIMLAFFLPTILDPVTIDGTTQPGFTGSPIIELNGSLAGPANGLSIDAGGTTVRGLVINSFQGNNLTGNGILLDDNGGNVIEGNFIGTDVT